MAGFRGLLYTLAKLMGDYNAAKKGKVGNQCSSTLLHWAGSLMCSGREGSSSSMFHVISVYSEGFK